MKDKKKVDNKKSKNIKDLEAEVSKLKKSLESERALSEELKVSLMKALADYQNLEKNNQKRIDLMSFQLKKELAKSLIEVADSIYFALNSLKDIEITEQLKNWVDGMKQVLEKFNNVLSIIGVVQIKVKAGDKFDSTQHEAIATLPQGDVDTIHEVVQPGYMIDDHVIRPSRVVVNKGSNKKVSK
jgi:molecular chaperone GrpE